MDSIRRRIAPSLSPKRGGDYAKYAHLPITITDKNITRDDQEGTPFYYVYWETIVTRFLASLILHSQSLYYVYIFDGQLDSMLSSIAGAGLEGVFVTSAISHLLRGIYREYNSNSTRCSCFVQSFWRLALIVFIVVTTVATILSDVGFQQKTGGERPDMWVVVSHIKNFKSGAKAEFKDSSKGAIKLVLGGITTAGLTFLVCLLQETRVLSLSSCMHSQYQEQQPPQQQLQENNSTRTRHAQMRRVVLFIGLTLLSTLYMAGAWMPIFHTYVSVVGSLFMSPRGSKAMSVALKLDHTSVTTKTKTTTASMPNVILVMHESLSGELMMTQESSVKATPFFHKMMKSDKEDYFVFEHARTVSGDTTDAISAIHSGCNPLDHGKSREFAFKTTIATEFKKEGYDTVSFSSRGLNLEGTKWFMTQHQLVTNFDQTFDPTVTNDPLVNPPGQDDREMVKHFRTWLKQRQEEGNGGRPFFAQFYYFNAHYPFFNYENRTSDSRLDGMLETVDQSIESIFQFLTETENLDNTIVIGTADHGERRSPSVYGRLREWSRDILHVPIYMHMPRKLFKTTELYENLRYNSHQLISTLDIFPTIMHLLKGKSQENYSVMDEHCVRGYDLLENKVASDRIAWSFPGVSKDISREKRGNMAMHTGISSSLLHRFGWPKDNDLTVVEYAPIIGCSNHTTTAHRESKLLELEEWKSVAEKLKGTSNDIIFKKKGAYIMELFKGLGLDP